MSRRVERTLLAGIELEDGLVKADRFRVVDTVAPRALVELVIHEGRNRIVRRMFDAVGHPVRRLVRTGIGPIRLGELRSGRYRQLNGTEVGALYRTVDL